MHHNEILKELSKSCAATMHLADTFGLITAVVLIAFVGDPSEYRCAAAYEKAMGLNLKERSSGKHKGKLKITKRGSPIARNYLYLAALRLIQTDPVVRVWYDLRAKPKQKRIAVVALMRKLSRAMWHMSRGSVFDSTKLFDVRRLGLNEDRSNAA
jgi:transposase